MSAPALHRAALGGSLKVLFSAIESGADVSAVDAHGQTAFFFAKNAGTVKQLVARCGPRLVEELLRRNDSEQTCLHVLALNGRGSAIAAVLEFAADSDVLTQLVEAVDAKQRTALHFAALRSVQTPNAQSFLAFHCIASASQRLLEAKTKSGLTVEDIAPGRIAELRALLEKLPPLHHRKMNLAHHDRGRVAEGYISAIAQRKAWEDDESIEPRPDSRSLAMASELVYRVLYDEEVGSLHTSPRSLLVESDDDGDIVVVPEA